MGGREQGLEKEKSPAQEQKKETEMCVCLYFERILMRLKPTLPQNYVRPTQVVLTFLTNRRVKLTLNICKNMPKNARLLCIQSKNALLQVSMVSYTFALLTPSMWCILCYVASLRRVQLAGGGQRHPQSTAFQPFPQGLPSDGMRSPTPPTGDAQRHSLALKLNTS